MRTDGMDLISMLVCLGLGVAIMYLVTRSDFIFMNYTLIQIDRKNYKVLE